ncbi:carbohydrate ABC transporter permease [Gryllotalpicola ginsengisoli]|uniref:carbohydrate ABC transporter permease n=1 Tax=Gryllotalpicola ginsengisoli TaxID=444608 RepID=UPI0003B6DBAB|nr:carbohydrate ABC transporter permease [Gryllotalpicola ginsengisoli]
MTKILGQAPVRTTARRRTVARFRLAWAIERVLLILLVAAFFFPFVVMLTTAFKPSSDIFHSPPELWPRHWTLDNFASALSTIPFWQYLGNTVLVSGLSVIGALVSAPLVAYALSKIRWRGRNGLLVVVLATMMLPPQVTMIPVYLLWNKIGFSNSFVPLVVPTFLGTPFLIYLIRQFLVAVPDELLEAARVDGASELRVYWSIVLPIARPALVTSAVFQFVWAWTDFMNPLIYLGDSSKYTLSLGLYSFFSQHGVEWGPLMAACVLFTLPAFAVFIIAQRYFISGVAAGALK